MKSRILIFGSSTVVAGITAAHAQSEGDVFWHLALGRAVVRAGSRVVPEPYAVDTYGTPRVVPEWLWGVLTWGAHQLGDFAALTWLAVGLSAVMGLCNALWVDRLVRESNTRSDVALGLPVQALLTAMGLVLLGARARLRPEVAAAILLPLFLWRSREFFAGPRDQLVRRGLALVGLSVLWGQLHGSFVLTPALFACASGHSLGAREHRRPWGVMLLMLTLSLFTAAHGLDIVSYILEHSGTDAAQHIADMRAGAWEDLNPWASVWGAVMLGLVFLWLCALALAPIEFGELGLAVLSVALFATAGRFGALWGVLGMPLAITGALAIVRVRARRFTGPAWQPRVLGVASVAAALLMTTWFLRLSDRSRPLFQTGIAHPAFPLRGAKALLAREQGPTHVFTSILGGAMLGFAGDGLLRVAIDSRIPLHFGDAYYGVYRDVSADPSRLPMYFRRYGFTAAVVERTSAACPVLKTGLRLVAVDPLHSTFVQGQGTELPGIEPCGPEHVERDCKDATALAASIDKLAAQLDDPYTRWLRAVAGLQCKTMRPEAALAMLPKPRELVKIAGAVVRSRVRAAWQVGDREQALLELARGMADFAPDAISVLSELWGSDLPISIMRTLYAKGVRDMDDDTPARERGKLALLCLSEADFDCAYVQGLRAAVGGDVPARAVLEHLAKAHPSESVRSEIAGWLPLLSSAPPPRNAEQTAAVGDSP